MKTINMNIDVIFTPSQINENELKDKSAIIIDVLRASTTISVAIQNGCKDVIPTDDIEQALRLSTSLFEETTILCGERNGKLIPGFDLGNSPTEYAQEVIKDKTLIYASTNGSVALVKSRFSKQGFVCGFVNISEVAQKIVKNVLSKGEDVIIICSGKLDEFSMEDTVCAGMLIDKIKKLLPKNSRVNLNDSARASLILYKGQKKDLLKMLKESDHGKYLIEIGMGGDLEICASVDSLKIVPVLVNGIVKDSGKVY
jgi:2-phosphosulfolactate phosphatase